MQKLSQHTIIEGTLAFPPELRYTPMGNAVTTFILNTKDKVINCNIWGEMGEDFVGEYYDAKEPIKFFGSFKQRRYFNDDGEPRQMVYFNVERIVVEG